MKKGTSPIESTASRKTFSFLSWVWQLHSTLWGINSSQYYIQMSTCSIKHSIWEIRSGRWKEIHGNAMVSTRIYHSLTPAKCFQRTGDYHSLTWVAWRRSKKTNFSIPRQQGRAPINSWSHLTSKDYNQSWKTRNRDSSYSLMCWANGRVTGRESRGSRLSHLGKLSSRHHLVTSSRSRVWALSIQTSATI